MCRDSSCCANAIVFLRRLFGVSSELKRTAATKRVTALIGKQAPAVKVNAQRTSERSERAVPWTEQEVLHLIHIVRSPTFTRAPWHTVTPLERRANTQSSFVCCYHRTTQRMIAAGPV